MLDDTFQPPSFMDNPLVGAIGKAMTMASPGGPVASVVAAAIPPVTPMKPPMQPGRTEEIRNSMDVRQRYNNRAPGTARGLGPGAVGMPGVMSPETLMNPQVQQLLAQYGVSPEQARGAAENASPNMFITNPAAYQKHPVLAGMIERGLEGAAFTQGSHTWGEGISNVAKGLMDANAARTEKYNSMLMMPFQQAQQVANLKGVSIQQQYEQAQHDRDEALVKHYGDMDATREELNAIKSRQQDLADENARFHQNVGLIAEVQKTPLSADEQKKIDDATTAAGGDPYKVDPKVYLDVYSSASQRKINADHDAALQRAKVVASGHVAGSGDADARAELTRQHEDAAKDVSVVQAQINGFDKAMQDSQGGTYQDADSGTTYTQGSPDAIKYRASLVARLNDAKKRRDTISSMKTPGAGMTNSAPQVVAGHFDPATGAYISGH